MSGLRSSVVTVGNFDGVHLGHQALVDACNAVDPDAVVAMFFDPHPGAFFRPDDAPPLLTVASRRAELLRAGGVARVETRAFDARFAAQSPDEFVRDVLVGELGAKAVVVGADFRFGQDRAGTVDTLRGLGQELSIDVAVVDAVLVDGSAVSSTRVRAKVEAGEMQGASALLGHWHDVDGTVVRGDGRGRTIGVPTANLDAVLGMLPADGVYAVRVRRLSDGKDFRGVANLGVRPTFDAGRSVEVHLLDADADLYDERLRVAFVARIRGETKFDGVDALVAQIKRDCDGARELLDAAAPRLMKWM